MIKILFLVWIGLIAGTSLASNNGSVFFQSSALPDFLRFTTDSSTCSTGLQGCASCKSATECLYCEGGWSLMNDQCVLCSTITPNCYYCNEGLCSGCEEGYYQTPNFTCSPCSDSNCMECLGGGCTTCKSGFYSLNGQCTTCPVGCYSCYSGNGCTSCENGYFHNNTVCCSNLCVSCDPSGCSACVPGAYMYNSDCLACPDGCYECLSPTECTSCYFFYKLSSGNCSSEYLTLGIAIILSIILTYLIFRQFTKLKVKKSEMTSSLSKEETVIKIPRNIGVFACCALTLAFTGITVLLYWVGTQI